MSDRVDATITIGGLVPADRVDDLMETIEAERLGGQWDEYFDNRDDLLAFLKDGAGGVTLYSREVAGGELEMLQAFCVEVGLTYVLSYDGYGASWGPARRIWRPGDEGNGDTCSLDADNGHPCLGVHDIRHLELTDVAAIIERLELFESPHVPPLELGR